MPFFFSLGENKNVTSLFNKVRALAIPSGHIKYSSSVLLCVPPPFTESVFISALCITRKMLEMLPQQSSVGGKVPSLVFPCLCSWSHQLVPCPNAQRCSQRFDIVWGSGQCPGNGRRVCAMALHPTVCRLGLHITWHKLFRWIWFHCVYSAAVSKLSIKTVNTPSLRPVQTHFFPTKPPCLNISEWLADIQSLPILPKPLSNLSDLIFKMFTASADSCTVQQQHQGECTYPMLCPKCCEVQREADRTPQELCLLLPSGLSLVLQAQVKLGWKLYAG